MHARKLIREAVASLLTDETTAEENVYTNRSTRFWQSELPSILIQSGPEAANPRGNSLQYVRDFELQIEIRVEANSSVDDELDAIALEIEAILGTKENKELGIPGTVSSVTYTGFELRTQPDGENEIGVGTLNYQVKYIQ